MRSTMLELEKMRQNMARAIARSAMVSADGLTLSSGHRSGVYFDLKSFLGSPAKLAQASRLAWGLIHENWPDTTHVGGMATGACAITYGVSLQTQSLDVPTIRGCMVRRSHSDHGLRNRVEGAPGEGDKVVVIDDVATTGNTLLEAFSAFRVLGAEVLGAVVLLDREAGAMDRVWRKERLQMRAVLLRSEVEEGKYGC